MGVRQSKRSVDITTTPKKEGLPGGEGAAVGDAAVAADGKLERIEEAENKPTVNGVSKHAETGEDKDKDDATEKDKDKAQSEEEVKAEETKQESTTESPTEGAEISTPTEAAPTSPNTATSPDSKETKKKDKPKKKWSLRSISFNRKDKNKPVREEPKNGDVTKEEPVAENGEETEAVAASNGPAVEEKAAVKETEVVTTAPAEAAKEETVEEKTVAKEEETTTPAACSVEEKKEESPVSVPAPVEEKKEDVEKGEAEKQAVEVSPVCARNIEVSVCRVQPIATASIDEKKTSEDYPSQLPSSPPPTPIDPTPAQQARQANPVAIAEALKLPAEAECVDETPSAPLSPHSDDRTIPNSAPKSPLPVDETPLEKIVSPPEINVSIPVVESDSCADLQQGKSENNVSAEFVIVEDVVIEPVETENLPNDDAIVDLEERIVEPIEPEDMSQNVITVIEHVVIETLESPVKLPNDVKSDQQLPVSIDEVIEQQILNGQSETVEEESTDIVQVVLEPETHSFDNSNIKSSQFIDEKIIPENILDTESLINDAIVIVEDGTKGEKDIIEITEIVVAEANTNLDIKGANDDLNNSEILHLEEPTNKQNIDEKLDLPLPLEVTENLLPDFATVSQNIPNPNDTYHFSSINEESHNFSSSLINTSQINSNTVCENIRLATNTSHTNLETDENCQLGSENVQSEDDLPPAPEHLDETNFTEYPLPPENLCSYVPTTVSDFERNPSPSNEQSQELQNLTETILIPTQNPDSQSNISLASSNLTKECSQTQLYDDQSNHEFKTESVSLSLDSYGDSEVDSKEKLIESSTDTREQQKTQKLTNGAIQQNQSTPEVEAVVENNVTKVNTTEIIDEAPKVAPPAVPTETPASPPSAPAITEDVASVTKAIEEIEISDKAVAAAVNEAIECNTNEIIADAHQNSMNE